MHKQYQQRKLIFDVGSCPGQQSRGAVIHPCKGRSFRTVFLPMGLSKAHCSQNWSLVFVAMHRPRPAAVPSKGRVRVGGTLATLREDCNPLVVTVTTLASSLVLFSPSTALGSEPALHLHVSSLSAGTEAALSLKRENIFGKGDSRDLLIFCDHAGRRGTSSQMLVSPIAPKSSTDVTQPFLQPFFSRSKAH